MRPSTAAAACLAEVAASLSTKGDVGCSRLTLAEARVLSLGGCGDAPGGVQRSVHEVEEGAYAGR